MGKSKPGGEDDVTSRGKYLLISVPDFGEDPIVPGRLMTSYLRLGAASTTWWQDPGGSLAASVNLAGPAGGRGAPAGSELLDNYDASDGSAAVLTTADPQAVTIGGWSSTASGGDAPPGADVLALQEQQYRDLVSGRQMRPAFVDDQRLRDGFAGPHTLAEDDRINESSYLHSRGGWRDHSDGNRITTTYGDKVEVIRGNYKLMVMGRQDDPSKAAGLDISGQHIQDYAYTWAAFHRVEWTQDAYSGVWHQQSSTDGAVITENFGGDSYEHKWGNHFHSTTGSEAPVEKDANGRPRGNPHIIEKTWAQRIESYTGSSAWRIPSIEEETWADCITSLTDANRTSETTKVSGEIKSETTAGSISESTDAGSIDTTTKAGTITEMSMLGAKAGLTLAGALADLTIAGNKTDVFVGTHVNVEVAAKLDFVLTPLWVDLRIGPKLVFGWPKELDLAVKKDRQVVADTVTAAVRHTVAGLQVIGGGMVQLGQAMGAGAMAAGQAIGGLF